MIPNKEINKNIDNEAFIIRLRDFILYKNISIREFTKLSGLASNVITVSLKNNGSIGSDKVIKICNSFPELNANWLLTGEGEMLKTPLKGEIIRISNSKLPDIGEEKMLPVYNQAATAGDVELIFQQNITDENTIYFPEIKGCDFGVKVYGDSMAGIIESGDIIVVREIQDKKQIANGKIYLIQTLDNMYVKYLYRQENTYILTSENKFHSPIIVPTNSVVHLFEVIWNVRIKKV